MNTKFIIIDFFGFFLDCNDVTHILSNLSLGELFFKFSLNKEYCLSFKYVNPILILIYMLFLFNYISL